MNECLPHSIRWFGACINKRQTDEKAQTERLAWNVSLTGGAMESSFPSQKETDNAAFPARHPGNLLNKLGRNDTCNVWGATVSWISTVLEGKRASGGHLRRER